MHVLYTDTQLFSFTFSCDSILLASLTGNSLFFSLCICAHIFIPVVLWNSQRQRMEYTLGVDGEEDKGNLHLVNKT